MWTITAYITRHEQDGYRTDGIPTFYLDENVQGILSEEGAIRVAMDILNPFNDQDIELHISAEKV